MNVPLRIPTDSEIAALPPGVLLTIETLAPVIHKLFDRLEALEKQLAAKGIGAPGTVTIDPAVVQYVKDYCWKLEGDVDTLKRETMSYRGVYNEGTSYPRGSVVTRHGSWWIAEHGVEAGEMPGHSNTNWRLCVKRERAKS